MQSLASFAIHQPLWLATWQHMLAKQRLHHAFLYLGSARASIFAFVQQLTAVLLCQQPQTWLPCGQCKSCRALCGTSHPDLLWLPGPEQQEKTIGIEQIRHCQRQLCFAPQWAKYRIAIIAQPELLTLPAQHALLKTLEEPIAHSLLFLLSPSKQSILPTIYSRCVPLRWQAPSAEERQAGLQALGLSPVAAQILYPLWTEAGPWSTSLHPLAEPLRQIGDQLPAFLQARNFAEQALILQQLLQTSCPWPLLLDAFEATLLALARYPHSQQLALPLTTLPMGNMAPAHIWASLQQLAVIRQEQAYNLQPQACLEAIWLHCWPQGTTNQRYSA